MFSGQFIYRRISLEKKKMSKNGKTRGKLKVEGNTKRMRRVSALLGKRVNLATNSYVSCWMVQRNGRRLIDGVFTDYLVRNSTTSQRWKRKRSKTWSHVTIQPIFKLCEHVASEERTIQVVLFWIMVDWFINFVCLFI